MTKKATQKGNTVYLQLYESVSMLGNLFITVTTLPRTIILVETVQSLQLKLASLASFFIKGQTELLFFFIPLESLRSVASLLSCISILCIPVV